MQIFFEFSATLTIEMLYEVVYNINEFGVVPHQSRKAAAKKTARPYKNF